MKLFFSLFFLFSTLLFALSDSALLKRADHNLASKDKSNIFRAYNDYKNLYLKAIMDGNEILRVKALQGIVKSGKRLHIDVKSYENELKKTPHKTHKKYNKPKAKPLKKSKKLKQIKINKINKLQQAKWIDGRLVLSFSKELRKKDVNFFHLYNGKSNTYKYVFDIHGVLDKPLRLSKRGIRSIKVSQFKPNTIRLVFMNNDVMKIRFAVIDDELRILINSSKSFHDRKKSSVKKTKKASTSSTPSYFEQRTIVIDPGHGGKDPGAIGYKHYREKVVVLDIAKYVKRYLESRGYKVYMTRDKDRFIKLSHRTKYANRKKADLFISIHANASKNQKAMGIETYFLSPSRSNRAKRVAAMENKADVDEMSFYGKQSFLMFMNNHKIIASNKLAIDLQQGMLLELRKRYKNIVDGGVREGPFWVLVGAQMPAVLIEVGFITNPKEAKRLVNKTYQKKIAKGIADGIERYFIKNR